MTVDRAQVSLPCLDRLLNEYNERTSELAPADLLKWLHRR